ncbi:MAG: DUF2235 domain-containing protein [Polyangiaceae bacterium]|nr:DUF2235 domain-containing protein [Polyangiaceae bacterium]
MAALEICWRCEVVLRIGVFFDGTLNSRYNTAFRNKAENEGHPERVPKEEKDDGSRKEGPAGSYDADYTNIPKLYDIYPPENTMATIKGEGNKDENYVYGREYVEGVGAVPEERAGEEDKWFLGAGGNYGETNTTAKIDAMHAKIARFINYWDIFRAIVRVELDIFGFSRGATSARVFAKMVKTEGIKGAPESIKKTGKSLKSITRIKFIGLFDTVETDGVTTSRLETPTTTDLPKDIADVEVYQLAAVDEYRKNFPLTSLRSDLKELPKAGVVWEEGKFKEKYARGVHADVGGGYRDGFSEKVTTDRGVVSGKNQADQNGKAALEKRQRTDVDPGALSSQVELDHQSPMGDEDWKYRVISTRKVSTRLTQKYLLDMYDEAKSKGVPFTGEPATNKGRDEMSEADIRGGIHHSANIDGGPANTPSSDGKRVIYPNR